VLKVVIAVETRVERAVSLDEGRRLLGEKRRRSEVSLIAL
jgi:hypothetical protein